VAAVPAGSTRRMTVQRPPSSHGRAPLRLLASGGINAGVPRSTFRCIWLVPAAASANSTPGVSVTPAPVKDRLAPQLTDLTQPSTDGRGAWRQATVCIPSHEGRSWRVEVVGEGPLARAAVKRGLIGSASGTIAA
jgi:hypothetical protein